MVSGTYPTRRPLTSLPPSSPTLTASTTHRPLSDADVRLTHAPSLHSTSHPSNRERTGAWNYGYSKREYSRKDAVVGRGEWKVLVGVVGLAMVVRLWRLGHPSSVVFDEVHFGGFANKYLSRQFFMDVHPPLAKMLITLAGAVGGFRGGFDFKDIGKDYLEPGVPYVAMRLLPALLGVAVVPIGYLTLRSLSLRRSSALLGSLLITFENSLVTQSRLILLDSPLVFFTALTTLFWIKFSNEDFSGVAFSRAWWKYLLLTGLSLGAVLSCKWVGLFTISLVGLSTLRQLWLLLGNLRVTPRNWLRHFAARALCLIVVPAVFYMAMFRVHFCILNKSGEGDGFMSSEFQHTLQGHGMEDTFADVSLGSKVSIRHVNTQGGYLHSHAHSYPGGSNQQQITLYPHRDENNVWRVVNASADATGGPITFDWDDIPVEHISNGMKVRFEHIVTDKRLHSHDVRPPISDVDFQNEVSAYGFPGFGGDANDDFIVEIAPTTRGNKDRRKAKERIRALRSHFRLRHVMSGCYLFSHKVKLPEWGFEQQEVTCNKNPTWDNSLWYVETNNHAQLKPGKDEMVNYNKPSFMTKFLELQAVMWRTNAGLTERHAYDSRPSSWPLLRRGINFWVKDHQQVYLIGNPWIWWTSTIALLTYIGARGLLILRAQRGFRDLEKPTIQTYDEICGFLALGWFLHYFPFFIMGRQLFLHHYLPALYYAILCLTAVLDLATRRLRSSQRSLVLVAFLLGSLYCFSHFSPLAYGTPWTKGQCESSKWMKNWDFSCNDFLAKKQDYAAQGYSPVPSQLLPSVDENTATLVGLGPEPGKDRFQLSETVEAATSASYGPQRVEDIPVEHSIGKAGGDADEKTAAILQDTRAPLGRDAGAAEATFADAVGGGAGWQGGAEDEAGVVVPAEPSTAPGASSALEVQTSANAGSIAGDEAAGAEKRVQADNEAVAVKSVVDLDPTEVSSFLAELKDQANFGEGDE